ncbi:MAG TPA: hypothetical protein VMJ74_02245, partial [Pseudomonadales bacterium]|nr:hypothetical protein [Pseudomonadales bacterium]
VSISDRNPLQFVTMPTAAAKCKATRSASVNSAALAQVGGVRPRSNEGCVDERGRVRASGALTNAAAFPWMIRFAPF